jgi:hypothetical protein
VVELAIVAGLATLVPVTGMLGAVQAMLAAGLAMQADTQSQVAADTQWLAVVVASTVVGAASAAADTVAAVVDTGNRTWNDPRGRLALGASRFRFAVYFRRSASVWDQVAG